MDAANAVLEEGGTDEEAIFACIHATGKSEGNANMNRTNNDNVERRYIPAELRVQEDGSIEGYAAVFNEWSEDLGGFRERIRPGAFSKTIQEADVRGLFNHDANYVLGRNRSRTLSLSEDESGLYFKAKAPNTQWANDLRESIRRGDIDQASFGFTTIRDDWKRGDNGDLHERELIEVKLFDVSVVTFPAYPQTSVTARSMAEQLEATSTPGQEPHLEGGLAAEELSRTRALIQKRKAELRKLKIYSIPRGEK